MGGVVASYPLLSLTPTPVEVEVEVELGCDNSSFTTFLTLVDSKADRGDNKCRWVGRSTALLVNRYVGPHPMFELVLDSGKGPSSDMHWNTVECLSSSVLETCSSQILILPYLPTCCTPGSVGVVTGDGLIQVQWLSCSQCLDSL